VAGGTGVVHADGLAGIHANLSVFKLVA